MCRNIIFQFLFFLLHPSISDHILNFRNCNLTAWGNPHVGLADLRIESTICIFANLRITDCPTMGQKRMRICILHPQSAFFANSQLCGFPNTKLCYFFNAYLYTCNSYKHINKNKYKSISSGFCYIIF